MYIEERHMKIMDALQATGRIDVCELADTFHVSKETIRRDLRALEKSRRLLRTHGGAIISKTASATVDYHELPVSERTTKNISEKNIICRYAASKVQNGDTLFIDNSTTCIHLYQYLPQEKQLTILTNSIPFLIECSKTLSPNHTIICLGGILKNSNLSIYGNITLQNAKQYFPNKAFISCTGIISQSQITDSGVQEIDIKRFLLSVSQEVYLLADHTKFQPAGQVYLSNFFDIDYLVTDERTDFSYLDLSDEMRSKIIITK